MAVDNVALLLAQIVGLVVFQDFGNVVIPLSIPFTLNKSLGFMD